MAMPPEMRGKVETAFQRQIPEQNGLVPRPNLVEMLEALGLSKEEAMLLLYECDPGQQSHLLYKDFLDFIFAPRRAQLPLLEGDKAPASDAIKADKPAGEPLKWSDVPAEPQAGVDETETATPQTTPTTNGGAAGVPSQDSPPENPDVKSDGGVLDKATQNKEKPVEKVKEGQCSRPDCDQPASASSKYCSLDCMDAVADKKLAGAARNKPSTKKLCSSCSQRFAKVYVDPSDNMSYCEECWINFYGSRPNRKGPALTVPTHLVRVINGKCWHEDKIIQAWHDQPIKGWPGGPFSQKGVEPEHDDLPGIRDFWAPVFVRLNPGLVGSHARSCTQNTNKPFVGDTLCDRYRVEEVVGAGHFTRALLATDVRSGNRVCVKKHHNITIELLTDLLTIGHRLHFVDPDSKYFPQMFDAFYDIEGYTVESLIQGQNCLLVMRADPEHFKNFANLRHVAKQGYEALVHMARAGVVHTDLKADNIMWIAPTEDSPEPIVRLVDFGCSRLDSRIEGGRNWAFAEGGAGHVGKWAPEMMLRLKITHKADVWGLAVALCELYACRAAWCGEADTVEVILAQVLGLADARNGLPPELLRQSPLDIRQLYTPQPSIFPVQRYGTFGLGASFQELRPATWGLGCVLGNETKWDEPRIIFASFVHEALTLNQDLRPSAEDMLSLAFVTQAAESNQKVVEDWRLKKSLEASEAAAGKEEDVIDPGPTYLGTSEKVQLLEC